MDRQVSSQWRLACAAVIAATCVVFAFTATAFALQPPRPGEVDRLRDAGRLDEAVSRARALGNDEVAPDLIERLQEFTEPAGTDGRSKIGPLAAPEFPLMGEMPKTGPVRAPVVLIDFWDYPAEVTEEQLQQMMTGDGFPGYEPTESVRNYYLRSSYGQLDLQPEVLGIYHYPGYRWQIDSTDGHSEVELVQQAFAYFNSQGTDFSQFDANGDGQVDYEVIFWTGPAGEWASFWWGHYGVSGDYDVLFDGKRLSAWSWQWSPTPSSLSASVVIHETGHALGLPDLYDYDDTVGPRGGVGMWDPMSANTGDHNAVSKWMLGWLTPSVVSEGSQALALRPASTYPDATIVMPEYSTSDPFKEFFLVEARKNTGNDATWFYSSDTALQVWHFDATPQYRYYPSVGFKFNNSYSAHKFARVMEADGLEEIEAGKGTNTGDLFQPGQEFGPSTTPASTPYYGLSSGVSLTSVSRVGSNIHLTASILSHDYDHSAPISTCNIPDGWVTEPFTIEVAAADGSPTDTFLRFPDYGDSIFQNSSGFYWSTEGTTRVDFWAVDYAGNAEDPQTAYLRIDTGAPWLSLDPLEYYTGTARIPLTATDGVSGLKVLRYRIDGGEWIESDEASCSALGHHDLEVYAEDVAGNHSSATAEFSVVRPATLALTSASAPALPYGVPFRIAGTLTSGGAGVSAETVVLQSAFPGGSYADAGRSVQTDGGGGFAFEVRPSRRTHYRVRLAGSGYGPAVSESVYAKPKAWVRTPVAPRTMSHSRYYTVYGSIKPYHSSGTYAVRIYRWKRTASGGWKSYGYVRAKTSNRTDTTRYSRTMRLPSTGKWRLRAYAVDDSRHAPAWSGGFDYVTVR